MNITRKEEWYLVKQKDFIAKGGASVLNHYGGSVAKAVMNVLKDEHQWIPWKFRTIPKNYWKEKQHVNNYFDWLGKEMNIINPKEWSNISRIVILKTGGNSLLKKYGGWINLYFSQFKSQEFLPNFSIPTPYFHSNTSPYENKVKWSKSQWFLLKTLQLYFSSLSPNKKVDILVNYSHPKLKYPTGQPMELDIYIPDYNIAFEYQGEHHYLDFYLFSSDSDIIQRRDLLKSLSCKRENISLIPIPFWWNREKEVHLFLSFSFYAGNYCNHSKVST